MKTVSRTKRVALWVAKCTGAAAILLLIAQPMFAQANFCAPTGLETLQTIHPTGNYTPGETVLVTGAGYGPSCSVKVRVTRPDRSVVKGDGSETPGNDVVLTDGVGNFSYSYKLGNLQGNYEIDLLGQDDDLITDIYFASAASASAASVTPSNAVSSAPEDSDAPRDPLDPVLSSTTPSGQFSRLGAQAMALVAPVATIATTTVLNATAIEPQRAVWQNPRGFRYFYSIIQRGAGAGLQLYKSPDGTTWSLVATLNATTTFSASAYPHDDGTQLVVYVAYAGSGGYTGGSVFYRRLVIPDGATDPVVGDEQNTGKTGDRASIARDRNGFIHISRWQANGCSFNSSRGSSMFGSTTANPGDSPAWSASQDMLTNCGASGAYTDASTELAVFGGASGNILGLVGSRKVGSDTLIQAINIFSFSPFSALPYTVGTVSTVEGFNTHLGYRPFNVVVDSGNVAHVTYELYRATSCNSPTICFALQYRKADAPQTVQSWGARFVLDPVTPSTLALSVDRVAGQLYAFWHKGTDALVRFKTSSTGTTSWSAEDSFSDGGGDIDHLQSSRELVDCAIPLIYTRQTGSPLLARFARFPAPSPCAFPALLTVNKVLVPASDTGKFNLQIDGSTAGTGANVGNGGTTGTVAVTAGSHTVGETAGTGTTLADYTTTIGGDCAADGSVTVAAGDNKVCTITNTKKTRLTINKVLVPATDTGKFNLQIDGSTAGSGGDVGNGGTTGAVTVSPGSHAVGEAAGTGTSLGNYTTTIDCGSGAVTGTSTTVDLALGSSTTCTFTNTRTDLCIGVNVDDGNSCTDDACDPATGDVTHTIDTTNTCSDGNACTQTDTCNALGACVGSNPVTPADDGNACTDDVCNPADGSTTHTIDTTNTCSDGNACTQTDTCNALGACVGSNPVTPADDGNACTDDVCNPADGSTTHTVDTTNTCSDGNACTQTDTCNALGACVGSNPVNTDDGNACTDDACDPATGTVTHTIDVTNTCSDNNACTQTDTCSATGACVGSNPVNTNDGNSCTDDACNPSTGAVTHTPNVANTCSDNNACTQTDTCSASGACVGSNPVNTDDGDACTIDSCNPANGTVTHTPDPSPVCVGCGPGNAPPVITGTTSSNPLPISGTTTASVTANFTDAAGQTHTCSVNWGDGSPLEIGTVNETNGSGSCTDTHTYAPQTSAVVYTVTVTITDNCGAVSNPPGVTFVVFYDPSGGFVTGGGWINSPLGAYTPNPALTGKANFGFVSKYKKNATIPEGETNFHFNAAGFKFDSDTYEWLVISGQKARYRGTGSVNGVSGYGFELTAWDGSPDKFRIKIWNQNQGNAVVYDNQMTGCPDLCTSDTDGATPTTALGGGSIVIHK